MRVIGMDIHRVFAEAVALLDGKATRLGRVDMRRDRLEEFARTALTHDDHVVVEATGNAAAVAEVGSRHESAFYARQGKTRGNLKVSRCRNRIAMAQNAAEWHMR